MPAKKLSPHVFQVSLNLVMVLALLMVSAGFPTRAHALGAFIIVETTADTVTSNTFCSLREAIGNANSDSALYSDCEAGLGNDTITFSGALANGTIVLGSALPDITDVDGLTILGLPFLSGGDFGLAVSGNNLYRVFYNTGPLTLDTMIIKNGLGVFGGGVTNGNSLAIINCIFTGNNASIFGGAIYNYDTLTISDSTFSGNGAATSGGGVYNDTGMVTISNSRFSTNSRSAVYNQSGTVTISTSIFTSNSTGVDGGGVYSSGSSLTITGSTFSGNIAAKGAGVASSGALLSIKTSTFYNNSSVGNGGGVYSHGASATISNTTFANNSAGSGGGVYNDANLLTMVNSTFANNTATGPGGGIYVDGAADFHNSIFANSTLGGDCYQNVSGTVTGDHNLIETDSAGANACGTTAPISSDPQLGTLTGSPAYFPLKPGSPAIEGGDNAACNASPVSGLDQRGVVRPQGSSCDIGSYEFVSTFTDVPISHTYWEDIEILYANGLTAGCSVTPLNFCPATILDRAQSAVFMLRGNYGTGYVPPVAPWDTFADDWSAGTWAEKWAEGMYNAGLTAGCATSPLRYCPWDQTPRVQAAVFGLRLKYGNAYVPPAATGTVFFDMTDTSFYGTKWAEKAYADGLLPNCGTDIGSGKPLFCPNDLVSRGLAAYMIVRAKNLSMP